MPTRALTGNKRQSAKSSEPWIALERASTPVLLAKGDILFRQGDAPCGVYLVRKGKVRLYMHSGSRKPSHQTVGPGSVIGFPATFSNAPYSLTAESVAECELGFVDTAEVIELMSKDSDLCFRALRSMSQEVRRLRKKQASVLSAGTNSD